MFGRKRRRRHAESVMLALRRRRQAQQTMARVQARRIEAERVREAQRLREVEAARDHNRNLAVARAKHDMEQTVQQRMDAPTQQIPRVQDVPQQLGRMRVRPYVDDPYN